MRVRDGLFLVLGAGLGAAMVLAFAGGRPDPDRRPPLAGEVPGRPGAGQDARAGRPGVPALPMEADPPEAEAGSPRKEEDPVRRLPLAALEAEVTVAQLQLKGRRGQPGRAVDPESDPYAGFTPEELAELRAEAERAVAPLLEKWRLAVPGEDRAAAMKDLAMPLFRLLACGGPAEHLLTLEEAAERGETEAERKWAVIAAHRLRQAPAVDFLIARSSSPHREVRFYGVEGLAWVRGEERARAVDGVVRGLEDPDPGVRGIAAISLGAIVADPARAEAILDRLARETDAGAAEAMAKAVELLDPAEGKARAAAVRAGAK